MTGVQTCALPILGLLPSASVGIHTSVFEPIHGSYPQAAGNDIANPIGTVLSAALLLELGLKLPAEAKAVRDALKSSGIKTADQAAAEMAARYGDKPAAIADLAQEGVGTAAGLSRLPGKTGEAAKARNADLLENRSGRLFTDIESTTGIDPANVKIGRAHV